MLERALEYRRKVYSPDSSYIAAAALHLARARIALGQLDAAAELLPIAAGHVPGEGFEERTLVVLGHQVRGLHALRTGDPAHAREHLEHALPIVLDEAFPECRMATDVVLTLADARWADPAARPQVVAAYLPRARAS